VTAQSVVETRWGPQRRRLAAAALATTAATVSVSIALGGSLQYAAVWCALAITALVFPSWITGHVLGGLAIAASHLLGAAEPPLFLLPIVAGIIASTELLAATARLDSPVAREPRGEVSRSAVAAAIGATVYGLVAFSSGLPGPPGIAGVGLAAAACLALAIVLVRSA
jgi:hypothetical protein